jgi:SAM-dependent methyltransferase
MIWNEPVKPEVMQPALEALMQRVDLPLCAALVDKYAGQGLQEARSKYAREPKKTMRSALKRALRLGLDQAPPLRVLDIGTGAGFFAVVCAAYGHACNTIDTDTEEVFADLVRGHGVRQEVAAIRAFAPFPVPGPYDLITAFAPGFHIHDDRRLWGAPEWADLLDRALAELAPRGRFAIVFNPSYGGARYTPEILAEFERRGAKVDDAWAVVRKPA